MPRSSDCEMGHKVATELEVSSSLIVKQGTDAQTSS